MINNEVKENGVVIGYRCNLCDKVKTKMWGERCNECLKKSVYTGSPSCERCGTFLGQSEFAKCACGKYSW